MVSNKASGRPRGNKRRTQPGDGMFSGVEDPDSNGKGRLPTIVDVAGVAGVAVGTVSRHLNGLSVRRANRDRIEEAIERLGYKRNAVAAAMKTETTHVIGLMVPVFTEFHGVILEHLSSAIRKTGRALLTYCHSAEPKVM